MSSSDIMMKSGVNIQGSLRMIDDLETSPDSFSTDNTKSDPVHNVMGALEDVHVLESLCGGATWQTEERTFSLCRYKRFLLM